MKIIFLLLGLYATTIKAQTTTINQPEFNDGSKTVDSLIKAYNCEGIEYNNWGDRKPSDSCLTVCLINSTKVPKMNTMESLESSVHQFKAIASAIRKALTKPQAYKSFYIIFIETGSLGGMETRSHAAGTEISVTEL